MIVEIGRAYSTDEVAFNTPTTGIGGCCARAIRADSGQIYS